MKNCKEINSLNKTLVTNELNIKEYYFTPNLCFQKKLILKKII